jgi:glycine cleavage system H protein
MKTMKDFMYSKEHEWVKAEGNKAYVGITDFAQQSLGDIVFVELPEVGSEMNEGDVLGVVESVKAASDIYSPVSGTVIEVNENLVDSPQEINRDPYENWLAVIELSEDQSFNHLMDEDEYIKFCNEGE